MEKRERVLKALVMVKVPEVGSPGYAAYVKELEDRVREELGFRADPISDRPTEDPGDPGGRENSRG